MGSISFGQLLEKLLYLSNQKKSLLAKELGYDISYISKWINAKNLPSTKNINKICKTISEFIVESLNEQAIDEICAYFEIDIDKEEDKTLFLLKYIEKTLKDSYFQTTGNLSLNIMKETYSQEGNNSISHVNPSFRKQYLHKELISYLEKNHEKLDILIYTDIFKLSKVEKLALFHMRKQLYEFNKLNNINVKFVTGIKHEKNYKNIFIDYLLLIDMISNYPSLKFEIYNCDVSQNNAIFVVKDKIYHVGILKNDGTALITNMSKDKKIVNELYYSLEEIVRVQGNLLCEDKLSKTIIKDNTYMEYIMGHNLRVILGSMSELFMPEDLFMEIAKDVFKDDNDLIEELNQINILLQNVTYKSKLKILLYESELRKYVSSGELMFFNNPITLSFKQREKHIKYLNKIIRESSEIELRLIEGRLIEDIDISKNASIYLSKNLKFIKVNSQNQNEESKYLIVRDHNFKHICDDFFNKLWSEREDIVSNDREYVLERLCKSIGYMKVINEKLK